MKTKFNNTLVALFAILAFAACSKNGDINNEQQIHTSFDLDIHCLFNNDPTTKVAYKKNFEEGDWLFVVFGTGLEENYDFQNTIKLRFKSGKWKPDSAEEQQRMDNIAEGSGYICAVSNCLNVSTDNTYREDTCFRMYNYRMMLCSRTPGTYKKENGKISGSVRMTPLDEIQLNLTDMNYNYLLDMGSYRMVLHYGKSSRCVDLFYRSGGYFNGNGFHLGKDTLPVNVIRPCDSGDPKEISYYFSISDAYASDSNIMYTPIIKEDTVIPAYTIKGFCVELYIYSRNLGKAIYVTYDNPKDVLLQPNTVYKMKAPSLSIDQIETKNRGDDLGNGWKCGAYLDLHEVDWGIYDDPFKI